MREHEPLIDKAISSNLLPMLLDILYEQSIRDFAKKLKIGKGQGLEIPTSPEMMASFFSGAIIITIGAWFKNGKAIPEEKLIADIESIIKCFVSV